MATTKSDIARKRYQAEEKKWDALVKKFAKKYGNNWTIKDLTGREKILMYGNLRRQKSAIDYIVKSQKYSRR